MTRLIAAAAALLLTLTLSACGEDDQTARETGTDAAQGGHDMAGMGLALAASAAAREHLRAEVAAQFAAFGATGLVCDHLSAHKHFHLHPIIARTAIRAAREATLLVVGAMPSEQASSKLPKYSSTSADSFNADSGCEVMTIIGSLAPSIRSVRDTSSTISRVRPLLVSTSSTSSLSASSSGRLVV